jgi:hypothetical protein
MNNRSELGRIIWETSQSDEATISATGANIVAEWILAAGYRKPRTVTTVEELDALPVDSVVMESEHDTFIIRTMRGVFHRFPDGWYVVAGHGAREDIYIQLPVTVLYTPEPQS